MTHAREVAADRLRPALGPLLTSFGYDGRTARKVIRQAICGCPVDSWLKPDHRRAVAARVRDALAVPKGGDPC